MRSTLIFLFSVLFFQFSQAQKQEITGTIVAFNKYPVKNVTVLARKAKTEVLTDDQGMDDLASEYPEVVDQLRKSYDQWWELVLPLMVNEGLPKVENHPLHIRYNIQLKETGIPEWAP